MAMIATPTMSKRSPMLETTFAKVTVTPAISNNVGFSVVTDAPLLTAELKPTGLLAACRPTSGKFTWAQVSRRQAIDPG